MDFEKMKQWMEVTQKYQNNKFWDMIFEQSPPEEMMDDFETQQIKKSGILQRIFRKQILFLLKRLLFYYWKFRVH